MNDFPTTTVQDPAVPMIALPARFRSRRQVTNVRPEAVPADGWVDILNVDGPGAVRHAWLLYGTGRRLQITVDGAAVPQVDVPFDPFFGVMNDLPPYPVDCAAYTVLPNFHTPGVPGVPGYNLFLPIPFSRSCRIRLHLPATGERPVSTMVDWQEYEAGTELTPYRLGAQHHRYLPAPPRNRAYRIADVTGSGFIAGVVLGARQRNRTDMVYHTAGMSILIDGEDDPHLIRGINMEDDFGFSWGFHELQTRWIGSPYHRRRARNDQEGVVYRFFGPDPIAFGSSISLRCGSRDDDIETMAYYYRIAGSEEEPAATVLTPERWLVTGFHDGGGDWQRFTTEEEPESVAPEHWHDHFADRPAFIRELPANRGWVDFRFSGIDPALPGSSFVNRSMYAAGSVHSPRERRAVLRLSCDDWLIAWLNGTQVAALRHEDGFRTARIPVTLKEGSNTLLIKTNNLHHSHAAWVANVVIEEQ
ncbi:MAG: DUF2961 domain-containing protein [Spirochaetaceae bacterium]|nr:DUF2961 domain-containing protein [Spirochaetaceae bacterium]